MFPARLSQLLRLGKAKCICWDSLTKAIEREKYDIGGHVHLHTATGGIGFSEFKLYLEPSYSLFKDNGDHVRIKATKADLQHPTVKKKLSSTINMAVHSKDVAAILFSNWDNVIKDLETKMEIDSTEWNFTGNNQQNN